MRAFIKKILTRILTWEAVRTLRAHDPQVIAITGSVGKTTTKDAIADVLETSFSVRRSEKSFNSEIGLPLTILGLQNPWANPIKWLSTIVRGFLESYRQNYPAWLVLEVGADHPNDIKTLLDWLRTDIVVFTRFAETPVHVEFFSSPEAVLYEKLSLIYTLAPDGAIVVNADDPHFSRGVASVNRNARVVTYGLVPPADVLNSEIHTLYESNRPVGIEYDVQAEEFFYAQKRGVLGTQHVYPTLAAFAVANLLRIHGSLAAEALKATPSARGRMNILAGIKDTTIIDDTYNSSPVAAFEALKVLKHLETNGKKIAILGDMLELGDYAEHEHEKLGKQAAEVADILIAVGTYAEHIANGALLEGLSEKYVIQCKNAIDAGKETQARAQEGDILLFKGSQGTRMEHAVLEVLAEPERASELLVRQDPEWRNR